MREADEIPEAYVREIVSNDGFNVATYNKEIKSDQRDKAALRFKTPEEKASGFRYH